MAHEGRQERIIGRFADPTAAARAAEALRADEGGEVAVDRAEDIELSHVAEHRLEVSQAVPGFGISTGGMVRGAVTWAVAGAVVGAVLVGLIGIPVDIDWSAFGLDGWHEWLDVGLFALIGALGLSAAAFSVGGGRQPEREWEMRDTSGDVVVAATTQVRTPQADAIARAMVDAGAVTVAHAERTARGTYEVSV